MISFEQTRGLALAVLLAAAGCGSDGDDDDDNGPDTQPDGNVPTEAGIGDDASTGDDAGELDAGDDGGTEPLLDASTDGGIAEASTPDASNEREAALDRGGVRVDAQRVEIVLPAFCARGAQCGFDADAGITESSCLMEILGSWEQSVQDQDTVECQDALLDYWSCGAVVQCDMRDACANEFEIAANLCK